MGILSRRPRPGDRARIVEGEYAGAIGRILALEPGDDGQEHAVILIDDLTVPSVRTSEIRIGVGLVDILGRVEQARDDPSNRDRDYARLEQSGKASV